jgi:para-nitrobenzyl esterase
LAKGYLDKALKVGQLIFEMLGLTDTSDGLNALRQIEPKILTKITSLNFDFCQLSPFALSPIRDNYVIPYDPIKKLKEGDYNKVSVLIGVNKDEGSLFIPKKSNITELHNTELNFLGSKAWEIFKKLPLSSQPPYERTRKAIDYALFSVGTKRLVDYISKLVPTYVYNFNYTSFPAKALGLGAHHAGELPFVFDTLPKPNIMMGKHAKKLAEDMHLRWSAFIKTGDPNLVKTSLKIKWPLYSPENPKVLILNKEIREELFPDREALDKMADAFFGEKT